MIALVLAAAAAVAAPPARDLRSIFPKIADVYVDSDGLSRLELPEEVMRECRPDLSDVRLFDANGQEVPYAVDGGTREGESLELHETATPSLVSAHRDEIRSVLGPSRWRETYEITAPLPGKRWDLVFQTSRGSFTRIVEVGVITPSGDTALAHGSLFRLAGFDEERTRMTLPPLVPAPLRLRVTIEGTDGAGYLEPAMWFETSQSFPDRAVAQIELAELSRTRAGGVTTIELMRARGLVPDALRFATATGTFDRDVSVRDSDAAGGTRLGERRLFRVQTDVPIEELEMPIGTAHGDRMVLAIADGDSPELASLVVTAVVRRPFLVFAMPAGVNGAPSGTIAFGGGRAWHPAYDLERLLPLAGLAGDRARSMAALYDPKAGRVGRMGTTRVNPLFDSAPALSFAMRPGAPLDAGPWTHARALTVPPSREGLTRLPLAPEDLAAARADLADLRVIDGSSRQWPYLLEHDGGESWQALAIAADVRKDGHRRLELALPVSPLPIGRLELSSASPFFDREYTLYGKVPGVKGEGVTISRGRLTRRANDGSPIVLETNGIRVDGLTLVIEDGGDAPLDLEIRARVPVPALFLVAPPGSYTLLSGHRDAEPPLYELERVRGIVLTVESETVTAAPLAANPTYRASSRFTSGSMPLTIGVWSALLAAVIALGAITVRLARREDGPAPTPPSAPA